MTPSKQEPESDAPPPSDEHLTDGHAPPAINADVPTGSDQSEPEAEVSVLVNPEMVRDAIDLLMTGGTDLRPRLNGRSPLPAPDGFPDVRAWADAVVADVWDQTVRLAWGGPTAPKEHHDWGRGIFALRQVETYHEDMASQISRTLGSLNDQRAKSSELWADPRSTEDEDICTLKEQRAFWAALDAREEAAEARLEFARFRIKVIRSVLWSVVSRGTATLWQDETVKLKEDILHGSDNAKKPSHLVGVWYAALMSYTLDRNKVYIKTIGDWKKKVDEVSRTGHLLKIPLPSADSMEVSVKRAAIANDIDPTWPERSTHNKKRSETLSIKIDIIRQLAALYDGPRDEAGCPLPEK